MVNFMNAVNFVIQGIALSVVIKFDKIKFNTNNHWEDGVAPLDYNEKLTKTHTNTWIDKFHDDYQIIKISDKYELSWMKKANEISQQTGKFTKLYEDELELFLEKYKYDYEYIFDGNEYFVRAENVSFKYGEFKEGPYTDFKSVIKSMLSCIHGHTPIYKDTTQINLYFLPWININKKQEFRVFVFNNKITAISQQNLYERLYDDISDESFEQLANYFVKIIHNYFYEEIINKINIDSFSYDFAILDNGKAYFIEPNSFGKEYAAGSSLFDWINDNDILCQNTEFPTIHFRYTS
jgi:hypothetical protein